MKNVNRLGELPIGRLLFQMSLPACSGLLVIMLYNVVDTIFVGHFAGSIAIAALSVVLPVTMFLPTIGMAIGTGSGSIISRALGAKNESLAQVAFGNALSSAIVICLLATALSLFFTDPLLFLFGGRGEILSHAQSYFRIVMLGIPFLGTWMCLNNILRAEGHSRQAMIGMWLSSGLNIALDAILIAGFGMGLEGAAWATVISQIIGLLFSLRFYLLKRSILRINPANFRWQKPILSEAFALGASTLARQGAGSLMVIALNYNLYKYGGSMAVAVYGVLHRIFSVLYVPIMGMIQGFLPIAGFNFGAQNYYRVKQSLCTAIRAGAVINLGLGILAFCFPEQVIRLFTDDVIILTIGAQALRIITLFMPLVSIQMIGSGYFQAVGKPATALFLSMSRQVLILIPLIFLLSHYFGIKGVWIAFPISDMIASLIVAAFLKREWPVLNQLQKQAENSYNEDEPRLAA